MGFSRQEYWRGLSFPSPGDLPDSGIEPRSPTLEADALTSESLGKPIYELDSPIILFSMFSFGYQGYANLIKRDRVTLCYCSVKFALPEMISLKLWENLGGPMFYIWETLMGLVFSLQNISHYGFSVFNSYKVFGPGILRKQNSLEKFIHRKQEWGAKCWNKGQSWKPTPGCSHELASVRHFCWLISQSLRSYITSYHQVGRFRMYSWQKLITIHNKNSPQMRNREKILQFTKECLQILTGNIIHIGEDRTA